MFIANASISIFLILKFQWEEASKPHPLPNPDITLDDWLNMWGKLCHGSAGISGFPIWVKLLCQIFFDTIDRDHDGVLSKQEMRNFYEVLIEVPQAELDKVTNEGYRAMTAVSIYIKSDLKKDRLPFFNNCLLDFSS